MDRFASRGIAVSVILVISVLALYWCLGGAVEEAERDVSVFPMTIGGWTGQDVSYDKSVLEGLRADRIIYREFSNEGRVRVTLFVAYYRSLENADFSHSPMVCFTGQGWSIEERETKEVEVDSSETSRIDVNEMVQTKTDTRMVALYWYQSAQGVERIRGIQKLELFFERLL